MTSSEPWKCGRSNSITSTSGRAARARQRPPHSFGSRGRRAASGRRARSCRRRPRSPAPRAVPRWDSGRSHVIGDRRRLGQPKVLARAKDDRAILRDDHGVEGVDGVEAVCDFTAELDLGTGGFEQRAKRSCSCTSFANSGSRPPAVVAQSLHGGLVRTPDEDAVELRDHVRAAVARADIHSTLTRPPLNGCRFAPLVTGSWEVTVRKSLLLVVVVGIGTSTAAAAFAPPRTRSRRSAGGADGRLRCAGARLLERQSHRHDDQEPDRLRSAARAGNREEPRHRQGRLRARAVRRALLAVVEAVRLRDGGGHDHGQRAKVVSFSAPYFDANQGVLIRKA